MKPSYLFFILAVLILGAQAYPVYLSLADPFKYHSVTVITDKVKRGEYFIEELDVERYRICKVDIDRFLIHDDTKDVIFRSREPGGASKIGRNIARNKLFIPFDAPIGKVTLLQNSSSLCGDGSHTLNWPVIRFEIVE